MTIVAEAIIDWGALGDVLWTSIVGGVGVPAMFAATLFGVVRWLEARQAGGVSAGMPYLALALGGGAVVTASLVFGVLVVAGQVG